MEIQHEKQGSEEEWGNPRIRQNLNHLASLVKSSKITFSAITACICLDAEA